MADPVSFIHTRKNAAQPTEKRPQIIHSALVVQMNP